ncbi:MAG: hypothetical protein HRU75_09330 [Planctomycetia bacterium]|nr:MAG: hypothetical protein HRU75_09330 [Planctomycetia bacterium]
MTMLGTLRRRSLKYLVMVACATAAALLVAGVPLAFRSEAPRMAAVRDGQATCQDYASFDRTTGACSLAACREGRHVITEKLASSQQECWQAARATIHQLRRLHGEPHGLPIRGR